MKQFLAVETIYTPMNPRRKDFHPVYTHEKGYWCHIFSASDWKTAERHVEWYEECFSNDMELCGEITNG